MSKLLKFLIFSAVVLVGYMMLKQSYNVREIVEYGLVRVPSGDEAPELIARTRLVRRGSIEFWEVELPSKLWVDCDGDCKAKLKPKSSDESMTGGIEL